MDLLFVYGSLKQGYPNAHVNRGTRVPGNYRTAQPHPFYLAHVGLPCLLPATGQGFQVLGELYRVNDADLAAMDVLEEVGLPGGYERVVIDIEACEGSPAAPISAWAYLQDPALIAAPGLHLGPLDCYTHEHARWLDVLWPPQQAL
jgi:gamma-glutamylaminecyclotransferase